MSRQFRRSHTAAVVGLVLLAALVIWRREAILPEDRPPPESNTLHEVRRVVDGDTLLLASGTRVRLIGVDAPESVRPDHPVEPWGPEAARFTRSLLASRQVRLEYDRERLDQHGRTLAYVWLGERLVNEELLRAGLARWERRFRYAQAMKRRFERAEQEARQARRGIWSQS
jgi:micrococcal nuclease